MEGFINEQLAKVYSLRLLKKEDNYEKNYGGNTSILLIFLVVSCALNSSLDIPDGNGDLVKVKAEINNKMDVNSKDAAE